MGSAPPSDTPEPPERRQRAALRRSGRGDRSKKTAPVERRMNILFPPLYLRSRFSSRHSDADVGGPKVLSLLGRLPLMDGAVCTVGRRPRSLRGGDIRCPLATPTIARCCFPRSVIPAGQPNASIKVHGIHIPTFYSERDRRLQVAQFQSARGGVNPGASVDKNFTAAYIMVSRSGETARCTTRKEEIPDRLTDLTGRMEVGTREWRWRQGTEERRRPLFARKGTIYRGHLT